MHGILYLDKTAIQSVPFTPGRTDAGPSLSGHHVCQKALRSATGFNVTDFVLAQTRTSENAAVFCSIGDFLAMQLTGRKMPLTHLSLPPVLDFFDLNRSYFFVPKFTPASAHRRACCFGNLEWNPGLCSTRGQSGKLSRICFPSGRHSSTSAPAVRFLFVRLYRMP